MSGEGTLRTRKLWAGCTACVNDGGACVSNTLCGFGKGSLTVLSDGRCTGACALFVGILQGGGHAQVVTPGGQFWPRPATSLGDLTASSQQIYCQLAVEGGGNLTADPSLQLPTLRFPQKGQELYVPIAVASLAYAPGGNASGLGPADIFNKFNPPVHFLPSREATTCLPDLYKEAAMFSGACAITRGDGRFVALAKEGATESCSVPYAERSSRVCNATCPESVQLALCRENLGDQAEDCKVLCWSECSAEACGPGYEQLWVATSKRQICWSDRFGTGLMYKIGQQIGVNRAMEGYAWKAELSPAGAFFLCMFMMVLGTFGGYVAFSPDDRARKAITGCFSECSTSGLQLPKISFSKNPFGDNISLIPRFRGKAPSESIYKPSNEFSSAGGGGDGPTTDYNAL